MGKENFEVVFTFNNGNDEDDDNRKDGSGFKKKSVCVGLFVFAVLLGLVDLLMEILKRENIYCYYGWMDDYEEGKVK